MLLDFQSNITNSIIGQCFFFFGGSCDALSIIIHMSGLDSFLMSLQDNSSLFLSADDQLISHTPVCLHTFLYPGYSEDGGAKKGEVIPEHEFAAGPVCLDDENEFPPVSIQKC